MNCILRAWTLMAALAAAGASAQGSIDTQPGATVDSLLAVARERNPDYAAMRHELTAAGERVLPAGALMNPRFKMELQDITKAGEQGPTLLPSDVGATQYTVSQDLPWAGKRELSAGQTGF